MSYDLEIGSHSRPTIEQMEAWAAGRDLVVRPGPDASAVVERESGVGERYVFSLFGRAR